MRTRTPAKKQVVRTVVGSPTEVKNAMAAAHQRGDLVSYGQPQRLAPNKVRIELTLLEKLTPRQRVTALRVLVGANRRPILRVLVALVAIAVAGGAVWLLVEVVELVIHAVEWVIAHIAEIVGGLVALLILAGVVLHKAGGSGGGGKHCPGCDG
jgi:hypothetical protein